MTHSTLYVGNTHVIELADLEDNEGTVEIAATVELTALIDVATGDAVTGVTLPLAMPHVAAGLYRATLPEDLSCTAGRVYRATIEAEGSQSFVGVWTETLIAKRRTG